MANRNDDPGRGGRGREFDDRNRMGREGGRWDMDRGRDYDRDFEEGGYSDADRYGRGGMGSRGRGESDRGEYGGGQYGGREPGRGEYGSSPGGGYAGGSQQGGYGGGYGGSTGRGGAVGEGWQGGYAGGREQNREYGQGGTDAGGYGRGSGGTESQGGNWFTGPSGRDMGDRNPSQGFTGGYGGGFGSSYASSGAGFGGQQRAGGQSYAGRGSRNYRRSDQRIEEDVHEALMRHHEIDATDIDVRVENGAVTLTGHVEDRRTRRLAEEVVEQLPGVRDVDNQLRARGMGTGGAAMDALDPTRPARDPDGTPGSTRDVTGGMRESGTGMR
jgi:osmotically-inducible protein OsmY